MSHGVGVTTGATAVHGDRLVHTERPKISARAAIQILFFQESSFFAYIKRLRDNITINC